MFSDLIEAIHIEVESAGTPPSKRWERDQPTDWAWGAPRPEDPLAKKQRRLEKGGAKSYSGLSGYQKAQWIRKQKHRLRGNQRQRREGESNSQGL